MLNIISQTAMTQSTTIDRTDMALALARHVISTMPKGENLVLSPVSIHVVLVLIAAGLKKGPAQEQVLGFLKSKSIEEEKSLVSKLVTTILAEGGAPWGPRLAFANGIWVDQSLTLKPEFDDVVKKYCKADSSLVDFRTKAAEVEGAVNKWAEDQTKGLIKDLLPRGSVDASTRYIIANALYFKGEWEQKFDPSMTEEHDFFLSNNTGDSVRVPFMTCTSNQKIKAYDGFTVLGLPYQQGRDMMRRFSMYVFLPDARDGLPSLLHEMGSVPGFIDRHIPHKKVEVNDFRIPKFKFGFGFEASEVLEGMGLVFPDDGLTEMADSNIGEEALYVSNIFHKSCIEVSEGGTEAAAATAAVLFGAGLRRFEEEVDFVADHPFLFVLREDISGSILFIGQVLNPLVH